MVAFQGEIYCCIVGKYVLVMSISYVGPAGRRSTYITWSQEDESCDTNVERRGRFS